MKILLVVCLLFLCSCSPRVSTADLSLSMSRQQVIERIGQPVSSIINNGEQKLIFLVHDHAYGRDRNYYSINFVNDKLSGILLLPDDQQEMGPIDRVLRGRSTNTVIINNSVK